MTITPTPIARAPKMVERDQPNSSSMGPTNTLSPQEVMPVVSSPESITTATMTQP
jgi:hypothetical protein